MPSRYLTHHHNQLSPFFPRSLGLFTPTFSSFEPSSTMNSLFRLFDDIDTNISSMRSELKTFSPRFDVRETNEAYELKGELPGVEGKDVEIEFTDSNTLTVKGRTEQSHTEGRPPVEAVQGAEQPKQIEHHKGDGHDHHATVEDAVDVSEAKTADGEKAGTKPAKAQEPEETYWMTERSVGEFARTFSFPGTVNQEGVKASMKNGVLEILVPKVRVKGRKIAVE